MHTTQAATISHNATKIQYPLFCSVCLLVIPDIQIIFILVLLTIEQTI